MAELLVSACTIGEHTRYDGGAISVPELVQLVERGVAIPFCAEISVGFPVPRDPAEIEEGKTAADVLDGDGKVLTRSGVDVTTEFIEGAYNTLEICRRNGISVAILREKSPSCGSSMIYSGRFDGNKISGTGVVAELLRRNGITVYSHDNFPREIIDQYLAAS